MAAIHLGRSISTHDERRRWPESTNNVLKSFDGNLGGVQVFQEEDKRLSCRDSSQSSCEQLINVSTVLRALRLAGAYKFRLSGGRRADITDFGKHWKESNEIRRQIRKVHRA